MDKNTNKLQYNRLAYLDNIRSFVIFLVISMHSAVTYSGFGDWYYTEGSPNNLSIFSMVFFGFLQSHIQAWSMGALFFLSAYLATKALSRHGKIKFIKERLFRLGLPLLIYVFVISFIIGYILQWFNLNNNLLENYYFYFTSLMWLGHTGPLWFVQVLLVFCLIYVTIKIFFPKFIKIQNVNSKRIILTIILIGIIAFLIRLILPIGTSFYNLQFCYFGSYIVMFIVGIIIGENDLLENITDERNIKWLTFSFIIGIPLWGIIMVFGGALEGNMNFINGGFYWQSFTFALWEALIAIGFSIGILSLFKKKLNENNKVTGIIRDNAFGIYFFHPPIMISISLVLKFWVIHPIIKSSTVTVISFVLCLVFSYSIRRLRPIGILFK
jgi:surface polysaccharide O-acyltransferase-like enzyme